MSNGLFQQSADAKRWYPKASVTPEGGSLGGSEGLHPDDAVQNLGGALSADIARKAEDRKICVGFVDVVGFSKLMHADEEGTFYRWTDLREEVVLPLMLQQGGKLVKLTGDGILATFDDPVAAVRWGRELQIKARARRQGLSLRISLNFCRVMRDGNDLLGDGVNIAARLQEFVSAGGIIWTQSVQDRISGDSQFEIRSLGNLPLRKLGETVAAYELVTDARYALEGAIDNSIFPSIAVMPFANPGGDKADEYLAAGISEGIISQLSGKGDLTVISRSSTLAFGRQAIEPRSVGRALNVRYLVTGTLWRSGSHIRVSAQLLDTETGRNLTGLQRDFNQSDMFAVQDEIVETALVHLLPGVLSEERRRTLRKPPTSFTAYDSYLKALDLIGDLQKDAFDRARLHLEDAIAADPGFSSPFAWLARWHSLNVGQGWSEDPQADAHKASSLARKAIDLDVRNDLALATYGHVQSYLFGDFENAVYYLDRARDANPSSSIAWLLSSVTLSSLGRGDEAIQAAERALRLSPFDQRLFVFYVFLGTVHYDAGNFDTAIKWLQRGLAENPRYTSGLRTLAVAQIAAGKPGVARKTVARLLELEPEFSVSNYRKTHRHYADPRLVDLFCARLSQAGAPE
ncbi:tetratricopeptide repeat protein [Ruegeria aquimaris]|uniref:Tetratricopeptide repeat protein n=1 Tax=Ruegeria aquimaris TaxID=2984333 RepID=A0ABT3ARN5_9RHOB|nr:tetratricopeptide repeat protein [Ruegeria sp. XHP0148]MCV2891351.1 tetratricopeptide repeat protein [Ruegeria sp. XHP0148]